MEMKMQKELGVLAFPEQSRMLQVCLSLAPKKTPMITSFAYDLDQYQLDED